MTVEMNNTYSQVKAEGVKPTNRKGFQEGDNKNKPVSKTVIGASLVGLAALASVGVYLATKGKAKVKPNKPNLDINTIPNINEFKKNGQFVKGEALLSDGTKYTGSVKHVKSDGTEVLMDYKNGKLIKSKIGNNHTKEYKYHDDGKLHIVDGRKTVGEYTHTFHTQIDYKNGRKHINRYVKKPSKDNLYNNTQVEYISYPNGKGIDYTKSNGWLTKYENGKKSISVNQNGNDYGFDDGSYFIMNKGQLVDYRHPLKDGSIIIATSKGKVVRVTNNGVKEITGKEADILKQEARSKIEKTAELYRTNEAVCGEQNQHSWYYKMQNDENVLGALNYK